MAPRFEWWAKGTNRKCTPNVVKMENPNNWSMLELESSSRQDFLIEGRREKSRNKNSSHGSSSTKPTVPWAVSPPSAQHLLLYEPLYDIISLTALHKLHIIIIIIIFFFVSGYYQIEIEVLRFVLKTSFNLRKISTNYLFLSHIQYMSKLVYEKK